MQITGGTKHWRVNGKLHRLDGPAIEWSDGAKEWRVDGVVHRIGGPAVIWADGTKEWWLNGRQISAAAVDAWLIENEIGDVWTDAEKVEFVLKFSR
jgi:hypothetical protein